MKKQMKALADAKCIREGRILFPAPCSWGSDDDRRLEQHQERILKQLLNSCRVIDRIHLSLSLSFRVLKVNLAISEPAMNLLKLPDHNLNDLPCVFLTPSHIPYPQFCGVSTASFIKGKA